MDPALTRRKSEVPTDIQPEFLPELLIDSKKIETQAQKNSATDHAFARLLKTLNPQLVDSVAHEIAVKVTAVVDCTACAKCCRSLVIAPDYQDVSELSACADMSTHDFKKKYMRVDSEGDLVFRQRPCPFLSSQRCTVYESRPKLCRQYPYLDQPDFVGKLNRTLRNVHVCPIVFNTYERMKSDPRLRVGLDELSKDSRRKKTSAKSAEVF